MTFVKNNSYIVFIIILCAVFAIIGVSKNTTKQTYTEMTIVEGDTLWELAYHHGAKDNPGEWIKEVMKVNDMDTPEIRSGESLLLPVKDGMDTIKFGTQMAGDER